MNIVLDTINALLLGFAAGAIVATVICAKLTERRDRASLATLAPQNMEMARRWRERWESPGT